MVVPAGAVSRFGSVVPLGGCCPLVVFCEAVLVGSVGEDGGIVVDVVAHCWLVVESSAAASLEVRCWVVC